MKKTENKKFIILSVVFYAVTFALMAVGTVYDLPIDMKLFNPQSGFAIYLEAFGQVVYWGMWGPLFTVLFLTRHSLQEAFDIIANLLPFAKVKFNKESKAYKAFNFVFYWGIGIAFLVLMVVGWRKLVANVLNDFFDFSEVIYYAISAVVAVIGLVLFSRIDKKTLHKLEYLALAGVLMGIVFKITEECKTITHRVRFREMVAYSNGFVDEKGLSLAKLDKLKSHLDSSMKNTTDFSAFLPWYKIGGSSDVYSHLDSFPSGHTTYSSNIFMAVLFASAFDKLKKAVPYIMLFSCAYVFAMGLSRMIAGAHYLTDVVGGAIIGYTVFVLVMVIYNKFVSKDVLGI